MNISNHRPCRGKISIGNGYGPTSFWLQDPKAIFDHLALREGMVFVDAGCGAGEYALYAARLLGGKGRVIALDSVERSIEQLIGHAPNKGEAAITGHVCDITKALPLKDQSVDVIMLSTVLHVPGVRDQAASMFGEFKRVLRPDGILAVLECNKEPTGFGPPLQMRLSADEVAAMAAPCGLKKVSELPLEHTYLACFQPR